MIICDEPVINWKVVPKVPDYSQRKEGVWKRKIVDPESTIREMVPELLEPECYEMEFSKPEILAEIPKGITPSMVVVPPGGGPKPVPIPSTLALMFAGIYWIKNRK